MVHVARTGENPGNAGAVTRAKEDTLGVGMTSRRTRERLVARLRDGGISNATVLAAIRDTPRHLFVDEALASRAYEDTGAADWGRPDHLPALHRRTRYRCLARGKASRPSTRDRLRLRLPGCHPFGPRVGGVRSGAHRVPSVPVSRTSAPIGHQQCTHTARRWRLRMARTRSLRRHHRFCCFRIGAPGPARATGSRRAPGHSRGH